MKALFKLLLVLSGLLVVILIAVTVTVVSLDPNEHKDWISEQALDQTGRTLSLEGDIDVTFYPWLGVEVNKLTVGNAPGFGDAPFLQADYIKLRVKLMPILKDSYIVDTVSVRGAVINLAKNKEGISNWDDLIGEEKKDDSAAFPLAAVVLGGVDVQQASLNWSDASNDTQYKISNMDIKTDALTYGEPIKLELGMDVVANKPALSGHVGLNGTIAYDIDNQLYNIRPLELVATIKGANIPGGETKATFSAAIDLNLDDDTASISDLKLDALDTQISGSFNASQVQTPEPSIEAKVNITGADLAQLFKIAEVEPLASQIAQLSDRSFKLNTSLVADLERGDIDVSELSLAMLGSTVQGDVKVLNMLSESPGYKGQLKAAGPDLPTLMQVLGQFQGGAESSLTEYGVKLAKVKHKAFKIDASFDADMKSGDIDIPTLDIATLGIKVKGNLKAKDMLADNGVINGKLNLNGAELSSLLAALDQKSLVGVVRSINFEAGISGNASNLNLKPMLLKASVAGEQIGKTPVDVSLHADTNINLDKEKLSMAGLTLKGLGLNITGKIEASKFLQAPEFVGQLNVASFNLRSLMSKLNQELPVTADKKVFSNVGLSTKFAGSGNNLKLEELAMVLDQTNLKGNFSVSDFAKPEIRFALNIDQINADRYLSPVEDGKNAPITPETAASAAVQLPVETLQALNMKGNLSIGKLTISKAKLSNVKLSLDGKDGKIKLDPIAANLYQGSYAGKISINANGKLPKVVVNSSIKGVQIEPLLKDAMGNADLVGKSDISIAVVARGNNTNSFKQTLSGQAELKVVNGIVRGVDVPKALEQVEIMIESKRFGKVNTEGDTPFDSLTATLPINAGVVTNEDLILSAPGFKVRGSGILARLVDMTWKYDLKIGVDERSVAKNDKTYNIGDYTIPVKCRGKIAGENCAADKMNLAGAAVKKILLDKLIPRNDPAADAGTATTNATDKNIDPSKELLDKALKSIFK